MSKDKDRAVHLVIALNSSLLSHLLALRKRSRRSAAPSGL
jgi:hypothetical protein